MVRLDQTDFKIKRVKRREELVWLSILIYQ